MEPTDGWGCWTGAWALGWFMDPFFRAEGETGASERASGSAAMRKFPFRFRIAGVRSLPVVGEDSFSGGGEGSGTAGFIG
jgi:hypothetical protein